MMLRPRTHTDDVIDAMKRGVDEKIIRELGVFYHQFVELCHQKDYQPDGVYLTPHVHNLAKTILSEELYEGMRDNTQGVVWEVFMTIREKLTDHRNEEIEIV